MSIFANSTVYLKTDIPRNELLERFRKHTYLEEKGYENDPADKKFFRGTISNEEVWLTCLPGRERLVPNIHVRLRGIEHDMYLLVNMRLYGNIALPVLFMLFFGGTAYLVFRLFAFYGPFALQRPEFWVLAPVALTLAIWILASQIRFRRTRERTIDFIRGMTESDIVNESDIPGVFLLR
jgi:hypothetical protein